MYNVISQRVEWKTKEERVVFILLMLLYLINIRFVI